MTVKLKTKDPTHKVPELRNARVYRADFENGESYRIIITNHDSFWMLSIAEYYRRQKMVSDTIANEIKEYFGITNTCAPELIGLATIRKYTFNCKPDNYE